jgi:glycerophosphoryl diester phosphodiesterase
MKINQLMLGLRQQWRTIFVTHVIYTIAGIAILAPLFSTALQATLAMSGSAAAIDQDIARLLLSPLGLTSAILLIATGLAIMGLELAAMQAIAHGNLHHTHISSARACRYSTAHILPLLKLTLGLTLRVLLYVLPFAALAAAAAWFLLGAHDINYYLSEHPPEFIAAVGLGAIITVALIWLLGRRLLGWSLILPIMMFDGTAPGQCFAASEQLVANHKTAVLQALLRWLVVAVLLSIGPVVVLSLGMSWVVSAGGADLTSLALKLGLVTACWAGLNFLVVALNIAGFCFISAALYERFNPGVASQTVVKVLQQNDAQASNGLPGKALVLGAVVFAAIAVPLAVKFVSDIQVQDQALIIAHRGAAGAAPENTVASIEKAITANTDWVEIDVQETRDGQIVVAHDSDFMKLAGNPIKVWEGDLAQIQQIDIGSWFDPAFADQRPPTLAQVLDIIKAGDSQLVIELKYYGHDQQLEQRVVDLVEAADMVDRVMIMSLKLAGVQKVQALRPDWTVGLLAATAVGDLSKMDVDFLAVNQNMANAAFIRRVHKAGKAVYVWTINDALSLSHWLSMGVDGVITDEPALAQDIIAQRAQLSSTERLLLSTALMFGKPQALKKYRDNSP